MQSTDFIVGQVTGSHTYSQPGIYTVQLTVVDIFGQFDTATFEYVVAYDPNGGFVTGGGWIELGPQDWCVGDHDASPPCAEVGDKVRFGFGAGYTQDTLVPTGNTHIEFTTGDLSFHADSYDWLVVDRGGSWAAFQGWGRLNGELDPDGDPYRFTLFAGDGSPDTFRLSIGYEYEHFGWWKDWETGQWELGWHDHHLDELSSPPFSHMQPIGGGSIEVHAAKDK